MQGFIRLQERDLGYHHTPMFSARLCKLHARTHVIMINCILTKFLINAQIVPEMCASDETKDTYTSYPTPAPTPTPAGKSVRVSKALGSKGYDKVRLSLIYHKGSGTVIEGTVKPTDVKWTYDAPFKYLWTDNHLRSAIVDITPGVEQGFRCAVEKFLHVWSIR